MMRIGKRTVAVVFVVLVCALGAASVHANPTQEDVFKSISENMGQKNDNGQFMAVMAALAGAVILVAVFSKRKPRAAKPATMNHPGKLMKEIVRATSLRPADVRLLRSLAERESLQSPVTLMLCPSVMMRAAKSSTGKAERKVLVQLTRKLGIAVAAQPRR